MINLSQEPIKISEGTLIGHYVRENSEDVFIMEEHLFNINVTEPWPTEQLEEEIFRGQVKDLSLPPLI